MTTNRQYTFLADTSKLIRIFAVLYLVGVAGHIIHFTRPVFLFITPMVLLGINVLIILHLFPEWKIRLLLFCIVTITATFAAEAIGVQTKVIFGSYSYGNTLGLSLFQVPLIIAVNWLSVILGGISIVVVVAKKHFLIPVFVPIIVVLFDLVMEPVAMKLDYWQWAENTIPLQNFIAWGIIALLFSLLFLLLKPKIESPVPALHLAFQFVFFLALLLFV